LKLNKGCQRSGELLHELQQNPFEQAAASITTHKRSCSSSSQATYPFNHAPNF
jgi:hypothetical protein